MKTSRVAFLGVLLLSVACAQTPVRDASAAHPLSEKHAGSSGSSISTSFGFRQVSAPAPVRDGETVIVVSASEDIEFMALMFPEEDKSGNAAWVPIERTGTLTWTLRPSFPDIGTYVLHLSGKPAGDPGNVYVMLAEWTVKADSARPPQSGPGLPIAGAAPRPVVFPSIDTLKRPEPEPDPSKEAMSAFSASVAGGDIPALRSCLEACSSTDERRRRAFAEALESTLFKSDPSRTPNLLRLLEAAGLDPGMVDKDGWTLLQDATSYDRIDIAAWLLERGADVNARGVGDSTVMHVLSSDMDNPVAPERHAEWARLFLDYGVDLDVRSKAGNTALCLASLSDRQHELLVFLVEHGADPNIGLDDGNAPLSLATQHGQTRNAEYLKAHGARLYSYEFPVANDAAACKAVLKEDMGALRTIPREDFGRMVARTSLDVPATPLHLAVEQASNRVLETLCERNVDWNVPDRYGRSPLYLAVLAGRADLVSLLLEHGADPHAETIGGSTPFLAACAMQPRLALWMLGKGVSPQGPRTAGAAVGSESLELVKALGDRIPWDRNALAAAIDLGSVEIVEYLASRMDLNGERPADLAGRVRANRRLILDYRTKAAKPLEAPRRSGGIADKRGNFPYVVESWSPWKPAAAANLADCPVGVYVPKTYDGTRPFGLVVSMTNAKSSSPYPRDFTATLDRHDLIWVGFDPYKHLDRVNTEFCLAIVYNMLGYYNIDQTRIYVGGYSLGGQLTDPIVKAYPWIFDGAFFINIGHQYNLKQVPEAAYRKHAMPVVLYEGDYDYNRIGAYYDYESLILSGYRSAQFLHEPMKGHKLVSAASFERIISLLENGAR